MFTLGSARAAFMLYQNAKVLTGAASSASRYLTPLLREWSHTQDKELVEYLETLTQRSESIIGSIQFLESWSYDKGSSVQSSLYQARLTLQRIDEFIINNYARCTNSIKSVPSNASTTSGGGIKTSNTSGTQSKMFTESQKEELIRQMKKLLKEVEFNISSLHLAVSVVSLAESHRPWLPTTAMIPTPSMNVSSSLATTGATSSTGGIVDPLPSAASTSSRYISPSCLLRASDRLKSLPFGVSGDLVIVYGSFYSQRMTHAGEFGRTIRSAIEKGENVPSESAYANGLNDPPIARWITPMSTVAADMSMSNNDRVTNESHFIQPIVQPPTLAVSSATSRIEVNESDAVNILTHIDTYASHMEFKQADEPAEEDLSDSPFVVPENHPYPIQSMKPVSLPPPIIEQTGPPTQSIHSIQSTQSSFAPAISSTSSASPSLLPESLNWREVYGSAALKFVRNGRRNMYELHVTSLCPSIDGINRPAENTKVFDLTATLDFRSTTSQQLGLRPTKLMNSSSARQGSIPTMNELISAVFTFEDYLANTLQERFAFILHPPIEDIHSPTPSEMSTFAAYSQLQDHMRPLDIAYLARLCMYENMHEEIGSHHRLNVGPTTLPRPSSIGASTDSTSSQFHHLRASDEELWLLLAGVQIESQANDSSSTVKDKATN